MCILARMSCDLCHARVNTLLAIDIEDGPKLLCASAVDAGVNECLSVTIIIATYQFQCPKCPQMRNDISMRLRAEDCLTIVVEETIEFETPEEKVCPRSGNNGKLVHERGCC
jgi:hypothetical protein